VLFSVLTLLRNACIGLPQLTPAKYVLSSIPKRDVPKEIHAPFCTKVCGKKLALALFLPPAKAVRKVYLLIHLRPEIVTTIVSR
jgi:hypothetical protein